MEAFEILSHVDHTLLAPTAAWEEMRQLADEAIRYRTASVCVPPAYVARLHEAYGKELTICTVIGFPNGYHTPYIKLAEALEACDNGAKEIDMVINNCLVKEKKFDQVYDEIKALASGVQAKGAILKVIIETCLLTDEEKIELCKIVTKSGADFIKTSTGFGSAGATLEDVKLLKENVGPKVKVKAAGGIRTKELAEQMIKAGADRIGASNLS